MRVCAGHKQETDNCYGCTLYEVDNGYSAVKRYHSNVLSPTHLPFYSSFYFQGYKMVQRTTKKRRNGRTQTNLTLYSGYYLCSISHRSVRQAVGHQGKGRVDHRVARVMTMAQCAAAVKGEDRNGE